jgi:hypothetical protein
MKTLLIIASIILISILTACSTGESSSPSSSTPAGKPTYSQVLQTYPEDVYLCSTVATVEEVNGEIVVKGDIDIFDGKQRVRWYGTKVTAETAVTVEGVTFPAGALLTVDKDLNWIEVSSWD